MQTITLPTIAGSTFDIHDDVGFLTPVEDADRFIFSDESQTGDPMRYVTAATLATYINDQGSGGAADGVVTGGSVSGTELTLERSVGADVVITGLPSGGGGTGNTDPVVYLARTAADATDGVQELTLTTALEDGYLLAFDVDIGTGDTLAGRVLVPSALLRALPAQTTGPAVRRH